MDGISVRDLRVSYGPKVVINSLDVDLPAGKVTTIIGPNGCGKSTFLRAVGRLVPSSGDILLSGRDIRSVPRKQLATRLSMLPQTPVAPEGILVKDLVGRGRHPHQSWFNQWSSKDHDVVAEALALTGSSDLAEQPVNELSGGQRQRVWISMVLAQQTSVMFLDEPTTYLDLSTSIDVLNLVRRLNTDLNRTIVMVLHDINLAARYSDNLVVLRGGDLKAEGTPADIISSTLLQEVFNLTALVREDPATGGPLVVPAAPGNE
ncbi:ABC transporter ATP-binding protein [Corynebacterium urinipleomorphum]|uniref:ABC transporter ATP-binding protein n=1 Tax=Corynebacterium urinipleomorphum TaxID=1852380 RepID=UPI000B3602D6|nr:ABC transporter ATP-binding protein [Corynebacterium urinipleomorphum]